MADILVAEDYKSTRSALRMLLKSAGHAVRLAGDGDEALRLYREQRPALLLLDVMMPKKSGYQVLSEIRKTDPTLPILLLTARAEKADVVLGLGLGSDDYIAKPFDDDELLARIGAALRRAEATTAAAATPVVSETVSTATPVGGSRKSALAEGASTDKNEILFANRRVSGAELVMTDSAGKRTELFVSDYKLMCLFARRVGEVVRRDDIVNELWGRDYQGADHNIDQALWRLRKLLGPDARCIRTVYGWGYRYTAP